MNDAILTQHLSASHDINGNPRRLWLAYDSGGNVVAVIDEGYSNLPPELSKLPSLPRVDIGVREYSRWLKYGAAANILFEV